MRSLLALSVLVASASTSTWAPDAHAQASPDSAGVSRRMELRATDLACVRIVTIRGADPFVFNSSRSRVTRLVAEPVAAHGTGFFVDARGLIATAAHVVAGAHVVAVILTGQDVPVPAQVVYADPVHDVAFIQVAEPAPAVVAVPDTQRRFSVAEAVFASGFPLDVEQRYPAALAGVIGRENNDGSLYTSMAVNPGNSGGPVTDARGQLVGIVSRGSNTLAGAQGFSVLEPVRFITPALAIAREMSTARFEPPTEADRAVARVLADLVGTDTERRLFERTPSDLIARAADEPRSPEVRMLVAAHAWNVHVAMLERRELRDVAQLTEAERVQATMLRDIALRLTREAMAASPHLRRTYGFGRSLLVQPQGQSFVVRSVGAR